jgi:endoglucanase
MWMEMPRKRKIKMNSKYSKVLLAVLLLVTTMAVSVVALRLVHASDDSSNAGDTQALQTNGATKNTTPAEGSTEEEKAEVAKMTAQANGANSTKKTATTSEPTVQYAPISAPTLRGQKLFVDSAQKTGQPVEIASQPTATWLGGWTVNVNQSVNSSVSAASAQGAVATFVIYNIPARDCGSYSAGGASSSQAYRAWTHSIAAGIGMRPAIVIIEPDALAQMDCLSATDQATRYADIADTVNVLATKTKAFIYLDAGNSTWINADTMAGRLEKANVAQARGFAINVSNFNTTESSRQYGEKISSKNAKSYVIDTSRNGQGKLGNEWCNPSGRGLGKKPTTLTSGYLDAYLWVKTPGESDGECNGGPSAGTWWPEYAQGLIDNAVY